MHYSVHIMVAKYFYRYIGLSNPFKHCATRNNAYTQIKAEARGIFAIIIYTYFHKLLKFDKKFILKDYYDENLLKNHEIAF